MYYEGNQVSTGVSLCNSSSNSEAMHSSSVNNSGLVEEEEETFSSGDTCWPGTVFSTCCEVVVGSCTEAGQMDVSGIILDVEGNWDVSFSKN